VGLDKPGLKAAAFMADSNCHRRITQLHRGSSLYRGHVCWPVSNKKYNRLGCNADVDADKCAWISVYTFAVCHFCCVCAPAPLQDYTTCVTIPSADGRPSGVGYVRFSTAAGAQAALEVRCPPRAYCALHIAYIGCRVAPCGKHDVCCTLSTIWQPFQCI